MAAPITADETADADNAGRGTSTTPSGVSDSRSTMTPSALGSPGPGTNVRELRRPIVRPRRSGRAGMLTLTS